jgi:superfamily II RNA helicase
MVKNCDVSNYPAENEEIYGKYWSNYPYPLSVFQKWAIEGIVKGNHVFITAHTGSGKTLPAEFAIEYFVSLGKKVIYTGPIKSLINQKFYDFTKKYPKISFGILTGDIKCNPTADVLIVTAEILLNKLTENSETNKGKASFEMDFSTELACVVMDEIHYINDKERGHVWENTIMMLPPHIQMVLLSATIESPDKFASWCENIHKDVLHLPTKGFENRSADCPGKEVYLTNTYHRVVPLTHYSFITINQSIYKKIKDKVLEEEIKEMINKRVLVQDANGRIAEQNIDKINRMINLFNTRQVYVKRQNVLNQVANYLVENEMLPALCFVLSRKQLEICANELTSNLLEFDSKIPYTIDRECEQIMRKFPNYKEYIELPEYIHLVQLLRKGVAIHHSGIIPVFKEMIELLYSKGYIKMLFATETFSVGVNMPTKTVLFTDIYKYDGKQMRVLYPHEYTQMAGRAGRRNIDTIGYVIHLNNLFTRATGSMDKKSYLQMLNGKPQSFSSKFHVSYLSVLLNEPSVFVKYANKSMIQWEIEKQIAEIDNQIEKHNKFFEMYKVCTSEEILLEYDKWVEIKKNSINKKRKEAERKINNMIYEYNYLEKEYPRFIEAKKITEEIAHLKVERNDIKSNMMSQYNYIKKVLIKNGFMLSDGVLTFLGKMAQHIKESQPLILSEMVYNKCFDELSDIECIGVFSCFTSVIVGEDSKEQTLDENNGINVNKAIEKIKQINERYSEETQQYEELHYDLIKYTMQWSASNNEEECKLLLGNMKEEKGIFLGEFSKALLKINNIASELENLAEMMNDMVLLEKLRKIPEYTLKFVVSNQSLYI